MKAIYKSMIMLSIISVVFFPVLVICSVWIDGNQEVLKKLFWTDIVAILTFMGAGAVIELSVKNIKQ